MSHARGEYGESIKDYEVLGLLGKGGFATVYKACSKRNGQMVAIKMIDKKLIQSAGLTNRVRQEVEIHSRLKHPFVVELYTFFQNADYVYLVMELAINGELQRYMKEHLNRPMTEYEAACILSQVVSGILYLHSHRIMHRDISLSNLLLSQNMDVKIADFGLATQLKRSDEKHMTMCGTPNFISPEVASRSSHGLAADVWAIGCLLYTLLIGKPPFDTHAVQATLTKVVMSDYELPGHLSFEARDLINKLLKKDPNERIALQSIPKHPFMHRIVSPPAAAGTVAINTMSNVETKSNTAALMQQSSMSYGYNNSSASCDSGIMTFASSSTSSSLRPSSMRSGAQLERLLPFDTVPEHASYVLSPEKQNTENMFGNIQHCTPGSQFVSKAADWLPSQHMEHVLPQPSPILPRCNMFHHSNSNGVLDSEASLARNSPTKSTQMSTRITAVNTAPVSQFGDSKKQPQRLIVPPLTTERLQPTRFRNKNAIMSILAGGEVVVEFIKYRGKLNEDRITDICWISKEGQRIVIYEPDPGRGLPILDEPPELPQQDTRVGIFSYENLPSKHHRKYLFASRFISLVKASTPKVTYFSEQAKFHLMESMLHFEATFYDGAKVTQSPNEGLKLYDSNGRQLQPHEHTTPTATALLKHQAACLRHCEAICKALELIQRTSGSGDDAASCFPVIIGRRPNRDGVGLRLRDTREQTHANAAKKIPSIEVGMPCSAFSTFSNLSHNENSVSSRLLSRENDGVRPVRTANVFGIGKATELSNGIVQVQFHDGSHLTVGKTTETNVRNHNITYTQPNGVATHFGPHDDLPLVVREKLLHLPQVEAQLKLATPAPNMLISSSFGCSAEYHQHSSTPAPNAAIARVYTSTPSTPVTRSEIDVNNSHPMRFFR